MLSRVGPPAEAHRLSRTRGRQEPGKKSHANLESSKPGWGLAHLDGLSPLLLRMAEMKCFYSLPSNRLEKPSVLPI